MDSVRSAGAAWHRAALLGIAALVGAAPALAATSVTVSPSNGHPRSTVSVSGSGFGADEAVDIYFDTTDAMLDVTDDSGNFGVDKLAVPADALPGAHWITAIGRRDGTAAHKAYTVTTSWAGFGFTERGRRNNPFENVVGASNAGALDVAWQYLTGGAVASSPAYNNGVAYVGSADAKLYAFTTGTGAVKWSAATDSPILSSPVLAGANVYVGTVGTAQNGKLYAFKASTGASAWGAPATACPAIPGSPVVWNNAVYLGCLDGKVYAFKTTDGTAAWSAPFPTGAGINSSVAVANGTLFAGNGSGQLYALNAANGNYVWQTAAGGALSSPAVANGIVFAGSSDGKLNAFLARNGVPAWTAPFSTGGYIASAPAVADGIVYVGSHDGKLYAVRAANGTGLWTFTAGGPIDQSSPAVANGVVYVGSNDGKLYAVRASDGSLLWAAGSGDVVASSPAVADGMVFVGSNDGDLYAFALDAGNNAVYRRSAQPPRYEKLHPDTRLKAVAHGLRR